MSETAASISKEDYPDRIDLPADFRWPDGSRVAVCFRVAYETWSEGRSPALGPMGNPLPSGVVDTNAQSWAAYGARRGLGHLLQALEERAIRGTVLVSAALAEREAPSVGRIVAGGHALVAHSYAMDVMPVALLPDEERHNIERSTDLLTHAAGTRPRGWSSPRGTPSRMTHSLLASAGYLWHSDCQDDDRPYVQRFGDGRFIVAMPSLMGVNDLPLYLRHGQSPRNFVEALEDTLDWMLAHEAAGPFLLEVTAHAHVFGRPYGVGAYERAIEAALGRPAVWLATQEEVATAVVAAIFGSVLPAGARLQ